VSLVVAVLLVALVVARLRGGRLAGLSALPLRSRRLVPAALLAQLAGALLGGGLLGGGPLGGGLLGEGPLGGTAGRVAYPVGLAVSAALVAAFLLANRGLAGAALLALGLLSNVLVVAANGAMPVSPTAAARAGVPLAALLGDPRHELSTGSTRLAVLSDVVPVPLPVLPEVVSPGDVSVAAGLAQLVVAAMTATGTAATRTAANGTAANGTGGLPTRRRVPARVQPLTPADVEEETWPRRVARSARARRARRTTATARTPDLSRRTPAGRSGLVARLYGSAMSCS